MTSAKLRLAQAAMGKPEPKIAELCAELGVTKGSFYHHFRNVEDFRRQLLTHWSSERERQVLVAASAVSDPLERLEVLRRFAVSLHHEAEAAIAQAMMANARRVIVAADHSKFARTANYRLADLRDIDAIYT
jgi:AcrR family transcriptional regulator